MKKSYQSLEDNSDHTMKQVIYRNLSSRFLLLGLIALLSFSSNHILAQDADPVAGKALFRANCASCHKLDGPMTGPALRNVEARLAEDEGLDRAWIYAWVRNSAGMIKSGDAYANKTFKEYNETPMTPMPQLEDADIDNILAYTAELPPPPPEKTEIEENGGSSDNGASNKLILCALALLFALLAAGLYLVNRTLRRFANEKGIALASDDEEKRMPLWKAFVQNQFLVLVTAIFLLLASGYFAYGWMMQVGVDQGYQPYQPIHFSHKIHAGDNKIDCKYCHSSARVSKTSGIPSLNVCMNCHKSISEYSGDVTLEYDKEFYDSEIQELYKAAGWNAAEQKYSGEPSAVKWIRVHNLPDFVYFNHSQHVTVAGVECQTCHGPVEEMEIVYQYAPLTMGWCINCHRETNVDIKDNAYYTKIHEELSKKYGVDQLTVAQMGGLECGKCHY